MRRAGGGWGVDVLRAQPKGDRGACRRFRRPHPARRTPGGPAARTADAVRAGDQSQDREGARPRAFPDPSRARRRGDRIAFGPLLKTKTAGSLDPAFQNATILNQLKRELTPPSSPAPPPTSSSRPPASVPPRGPPSR